MDFLWISAPVSVGSSNAVENFGVVPKQSSGKQAADWRNLWI